MLQSCVHDTFDPQKHLRLRLELRAHYFLQIVEALRLPEEARKHSEKIQREERTRNADG